MVDQTVVENPETEVVVAPGGESVFDTDQQEADPVAELRAKMNKSRDKKGKFVSKKDRPEPTDDKPKDDATTDVDTQADDKDTKQEAKDDKPVVDTADKDDPNTAKELSAREIETAKQLGYSIDEIAEMDPDVYGPILDKAGRKYNKKMSELGHLQQKLRADAGTTAKPSEDTTKDSETDYTFSDEDFDLSDEDGISGKLTKTFAAMSERLEYLESRETEREATNLADKADTFFKGLDAKEFSQFGSGPTADLVEGSAEADARRDVTEEAKVLQMASELQGRKLGLPQAMDKAVHLLFSDNIAAAERRKITDEVYKRRRGAGNKPSHRKAKPTVATTKSEQNAELVELAKTKDLHWQS